MTKKKMDPTNPYDIALKHFYEKPTLNFSGAEVRLMRIMLQLYTITYIEDGDKEIYKNYKAVIDHLSNVGFIRINKKQYDKTRTATTQ